MAQIGVNRVRVRHPANPVYARASRVIPLLRDYQKARKGAAGSVCSYPGSFFGRRNRLTLHHHATRATRWRFTP